jgi:hypothetical protein
MTGTMLLTTIFEFAAVILIIIGLLNEKKLISFEDKLGFAIGKMLRKHIRRYYIKKKAKQKQHLRTVPAYKREEKSSAVRYIA